MTMVPPLPGTEPRGAAVPLAGMSPRRRPDGLDGAGLANVLDDVPPPLELEPLDEPPDDPPDELPPEGAAVPTEGAPPPLECWARAAAGRVRAPIRIADVKERVIWNVYTTQLPVSARINTGESVPTRRE